ncbi:hypothetical protein [Kitasatospora sp. NBC_01302]|uniref:hypothetical protein n=1 Tax=Kitasatospora sp. NBC_01302 TaxID=2903575 RepID=UPI002E15FC49|nr:hypothetical protein OG294_13820 [Kitasatospora sp. NBC_01302]
MLATTRTARQIVKARTHNQRQTTKALRNGAPLTAKASLIQRGLDTATAARFASAFSKTAGAGVGTVNELKLRHSKSTGRLVVLTVPAKTFTAEQITAALLTYRPKTNKAAAELFARLALAA